jgi:hypothetical protein
MPTSLFMWIDLLPPNPLANAVCAHGDSAGWSLYFLLTQPDARSDLGKIGEADDAFFEDHVHAARDSTEFCVFRTGTAIFACYDSSI